jgi:hypothetical protein
MERKSNWDIENDIMHGLRLHRDESETLINNIKILVLTELVEIGLLKYCDMCKGAGNIELPPLHGDLKVIECIDCEGRGVVK